MKRNADVLHLPTMPHCRCGAELVCPVGTRDDLVKINDLLREHGFHYPQGSRGVEDALTMLTTRLADAEAQLLGQPGR